MEPVDTDDMGAGFAAFVVALFGSGLLMVGLLLTFVFWPAGVVFLGLGGLFLVGAPVVGVLIWLDERQETAEESVV